MATRLGNTTLGRDAASRRDERTPLARTLLAALGALLLVGCAGTASADDARILDSGGRTLTVGNWLVPNPGMDGGKVPDPRRLGWELRDGNTLILSGTVPQTFDWYVESSPVLSRNPVTGEILLAWSRQNQAGLRDVVTMPFVDNSWLPARMVVAARGALSTQVDPVLIHDTSGNAYLAWRDLSWERRVLMMALDVDGRVLMQQVLSGGVEDPSPPTLGFDQRGDVIAAFFGRDATTREDRVFVAAIPSDAGGLVHWPNPIVELAVATSTPTPALGGATATQENGPAPHISVLSDTTVVWWTREQPDGTAMFEHLSQVDGSWGASSLGRIVLSESQDSVREALDMLTARFRGTASPPLSNYLGESGRTAIPARR